ncbi:MAG: DNA-binding transcriptional ArsR family regulator [Saprospiraceae bacterium]|jgi:DNA-binding transcriptional ArsR family regulator
MGITKTAGFKKKTNDMADTLKALGHPARLSIMEHLAEQKSCICNDIVDKIPLAQPTISRHLSELKKVGLIKGSIEGKNICYCINEKTWLKVVEQINTLSTALNKKDNCC